MNILVSVTYPLADGLSSVLCSKNILTKLCGYQQPTCLCVKMEFAVGTISLSLMWIVFTSTQVCTGNGVSFFMCGSVEVAWFAQNIRHSSNTCVIASTVAITCLSWIITICHILWYSQAYVGFCRVYHSNLIFKTMWNDHARLTFMLPPTFSLAPQCPSHFFNSRIVPAYPHVFTLKPITAVRGLAFFQAWSRWPAFTTLQPADEAQFWRTNQTVLTSARFVRDFIQQLRREKRARHDDYVKGFARHGKARALRSLKKQWRHNLVESVRRQWSVSS